MNLPDPVHLPLLDVTALERALEASQANPISAYKAASAEIQQRLRTQFEAGRDIEELVHARADAVDALLCLAWRHFGLHSMPGAALVAVGGYGRGELHPHSDVDLLILIAEPPKGALANALELCVTALWDMGLDIGHSVRTVEDCVEEARKDITVMTNLVEARILTGDQSVFAQMRSATSSDRIWPAREFFTAKVTEQSDRHRRNGGTAYNLEPNVKEGIGGLRDVHTIAWIAKRHYDAQSLRDIVAHGLLTDGEFETLTESQNYLWRVRAALHLVAGKHEDRLLFDHQREVAKLLGFEDAEHNLGVELFMKEYYRSIMELARLNEMLLGLFREMFWEDSESPEIVQINRRFQTRNGYLEVTNDNVFVRYPFALLELFLVLQQHADIKGVRPSTVRLVRDHRYLIDNSFRNDIGCRSLFLEIIRQPRGQTHEFRRMHTYGILAAYLPVFEKIVGVMQFDLFHAYTVDEHTLFVVRNLRKFMVPEHYHELPHCSDIVARLPKPELLYLAGFFHDIAKGRGGDHSSLGAEEAIAFCRHHGISQYDAHLVAWLVTNHLVMSTTAQRQDISDPEVVRRFAALVGDQSRLDYLYLLTVADIRATNPDLWNGWKDSLLQDLYNSTRRALRHGLEAPVVISELAEECKTEAKARLIEAGVSATDISDLWETLGTDYFVRTNPDQVVWHAREIIERTSTDTPLVSVRRWRANTEVFIYGRDQEYLFAATTTILERLGLNILDARIFTAEDGNTFDSYVVLEASGETIENGHREAEIVQAVQSGLQEPEQSIYTPGRVPRRQLRSFPIPTRVGFEQDKPRNCTIIEVVCSDRPGLLSRVGWALAACNGSLQNAKIATFGERVEDIFYVRDRGGGALNASQCEHFKTTLLSALESGSDPTTSKTVTIS
ncbi:MAG: [protein-PII] uridylyltransferase [Gammaproteobacteria bacterium]|nr:[protein-PII] uridylyltransferase [Gammaproteobacteria bacterium]